MGYRKLIKTLIISVCVAVLILIISFSLNQYFTDRTVFTVDKWNDKIWDREHMFNDFLEKYELIGMTRQEVKEVLGNNGLVYEDDSIYYIGKALLGPVLLRINYNEENLVESYHITVD